MMNIKLSQSILSILAVLKLIKIDDLFCNRTPSWQPRAQNGYGFPARRLGRRCEGATGRTGQPVGLHNHALHIEFSETE